MGLRARTHRRTRARTHSLAHAVQGSPSDILSLIALGCDVVSSSYPQLLADKGMASTYTIPDVAALPADAAVDAAAATAPLRVKANAADDVFAEDFSPLVRGCACFACANHTRAYVHHLLTVGEILGQTLLHVHNLHMQERLVGAAREAIVAGKFAQFRDAFARANA